MLFPKLIFQTNDTYNFYVKVQPGNSRLLVSNLFISSDCLRTLIFSTVPCSFWVKMLVMVTALTRMMEILAFPTPNQFQALYPLTKACPCITCIGIWQFMVSLKLGSPQVAKIIHIHCLLLSFKF